MHTRCVVEAIRRGGTHAQLIGGTRQCTARHWRRESPEAAVQADPGVRVTVAGLGRRPDNNWGERREELCYPRDQKSPGIAGPLDDVSLEQLQRFLTVVRVQPGLATAHAKLPTHMLGLLNHTLGAHRPNRQSETPSSLLGAIKLWYIVPELLHSHDSRVKRRERFAYIESGDITFILPWLMEYTSQASTRRREPTYKTTDAAKHERASSACRQSGGMSVAAGSFLAEPRAPGDKVTWERVKAKFPGEDRASVSESATEAVAASSTEPEEESVPNWRPEE